MTRTTLKARWVQLWGKIGLKDDPIYWFDLIFDEWTREGRFYHGLDHLIEGLRMFDSIAHLFTNSQAAELAWWLHDVIYDPHKPLGENERLSVIFAREMLSKGEADPSFAEQVIRRILATLHDGNRLIDPDDQLMSDLDLMRLGATARKWKKNDDLVYQEYSWVGEAQYRRNRAYVLGLFLKQPSIYYTDLFKQRFEKRAQDNLKHAIEELNVS